MGTPSASGQASTIAPWLLSARRTRCAIIDRTRPTTQKNLFTAQGYRMLKVDKLDNRPISDRILEQLKSLIAGSRADAIVLSDFRHGIFNQTTIPLLIGALPGGPMRVADSQVASRWGNILDF